MKSLNTLALLHLQRKTWSKSSACKGPSRRLLLRLKPLSLSLSLSLSLIPCRRREVWRPRSAARMLAWYPLSMRLCTLSEGSCSRCLSLLTSFVLPWPSRSGCRSLRDVHVCLLSAVIEADFQRGQQFGTKNEQDSVRLQCCMLDAITWPALLLLYLARRRTRASRMCIYCAPTSLYGRLTQQAADYVSASRCTTMTWMPLWPRESTSGDSGWFNNSFCSTSILSTLFIDPYEKKKSLKTSTLLHHQRHL